MSARAIGSEIEVDISSPRGAAAFVPVKQQARPHTPPRKSGGWAGVPSNATPKGHFAHRPNCNVKMVWHDAAAMA